MFIGVGAQSALGGKTFFPKNMSEKFTKCPKFTWFLSEKKYQNTVIFMIFARKINKIPEFYMIFFARKLPEFYIIIARKIFSWILGGGEGHVPPAPRLLRLSAPIWHYFLVIFTFFTRFVFFYFCFFTTILWLGSFVERTQSWSYNATNLRVYFFLQWQCIT